MKVHIFAKEVTIDKKVGRDGFVYGYKCPECGTEVLYCKHLSENTVAFVCAFCSQVLYVKKVFNPDNCVESEPIPFLVDDLKDSEGEDKG